MVRDCRCSFRSATRLAQTSAQIKILLDLLCMCADNSDSFSVAAGKADQRSSAEGIA